VATDTTRDAATVRTALYRGMSPARRCELAVEMSAMTRAIALESIQRRHPDYDAREARLALFRLLLGDELFRRALPHEPLLAP
jgi:hypothetical protein